MTTNDDIITGALSECVRNLESHGWSVTVLPHDDGQRRHLSIQVDHPLSCFQQFGAGWIVERAEAETVLVRMMQEYDEFGLVGSRPQTMPAANAVGVLRRAGLVNAWSETILSEIADAMFQAGLLTSDEAEWLSEVGPLRQQ